MKIAYKLTDSEMKTHKGFQWELGKWYETTGKWSLCSPGWLHFYNDPLVGMFMNPIHGNIQNPRLFRVEVKGKFLDNSRVKCGYTKARLLEELPVPEISMVQKIRFAILCAKKVYKNKKWNEWANNWLSGKNRTKKSAARVADAVSAADAANAAWNAAYAPHAAKNTAHSVRAAWSAASAACATGADRAAHAAWSAAWSADHEAGNRKIDLIRIARKAMD